jgi:hypothetical protein
VISVGTPMRMLRPPSLGGAARASSVGLRVPAPRARQVGRAIVGLLEDQLSCNGRDRSRRVCEFGD